MAKKIEVNDIVYRKKRGWSGVPMRVLEIDGTIAVCRGAQGWTATGLYSTKYNVYVSRYALTNLTHVSNTYGDAE